MDVGYHLIIDARADSSKLANIETIRNMLDGLPAKIGMKKISDPYVIDYHDCPKGESGVTGFVLLAESHISIHTYPKKGIFFLDIFSCKAIDIELVEKEIIAMLGAVDVCAKIVKRTVVDR